MRFLKIFHESNVFKNNHSKIFKIIFQLNFSFSRHFFSNSNKHFFWIYFQNILFLLNYYNFQNHFGNVINNNLAITNV